MRNAVAAVVVVGGCIPQQMPSQAEIFRYEAGAFRACTVTFGWSEDELRAHCGAPAVTLPNANDARGACHVYENHSQGLVHTTAAGAPFLVVCLSPANKADAPWRDGKRVQAEDAATLRVRSVYGMRSAPSPAPAPVP